MEKLEEELKFFPNINQSKDSFDNVIEINNQSNFESNKETLVKEEKFEKYVYERARGNCGINKSVN